MGRFSREIGGLCKILIVRRQLVLVFVSSGYQTESECIKGVIVFNYSRVKSEKIKSTFHVKVHIIL